MQGVSITASALGQENKVLVTSSPGLRLAVLDSENFRMYKFRTKLAVQRRKRPIK